MYYFCKYSLQQPGLMSTAFPYFPISDLTVTRQTPTERPTVPPIATFFYPS